MEYIKINEYVAESINSLKTSDEVLRYTVYRFMIQGTLNIYVEMKLHQIR